jgi:hypothetical protein
MKASLDIVLTYIRTMPAHGLRKGSATHVSCATTAPPPIALIANWGNRSLLNIYWQFTKVDDAFLGCCLCGLDPNNSTFSVLLLIGW